MSYKYKISVIIPSFRNLEFLRLCLPEYLKSRHCQVVIGLDGYNSHYMDYLLNCQVTVSMTGRRQGLCTATNLAAQQASGEYLFLCNDDMVPAPGWDEALLTSAGPGHIISGTVWEPGPAIKKWILAIMRTISEGMTLSPRLCKPLKIKKKKQNRGSTTLF